jgi:hypothetical protein
MVGIGMDILPPIMVGIVMDIPTDPKKLFMNSRVGVDSLAFGACDDDDDSSTSSNQSTNLSAHELSAYK